MIGWNESIKKELKHCGENVFIANNVLFTNPSEVVLHDNVRIDPFCLITTKLEVGSYVQICSHTVLGGGKDQKITLGNWSFIGYYGPVNEFWGSNKIYRGDITFGDYSGIASDVMVFPKVNIPTGCTVGAKSFVYTKNNLKEWSVFIGNPIKFHKLRNRGNVIKLSKDKDWLK